MIYIDNNKSYKTKVSSGITPIYNYSISNIDIDNSIDLIKI